MNRDEIKGKAEQAKGYLKDKAGQVMNDPDLEAEGEIERGKGELREGFGKAKRKIGEAIEDAGDAIKDA